jgi:sugar (pentulose or hexulose) kinase
MAGAPLDPDELYGMLYRKALQGDGDAGGIFAYNFHAGEFLAGMERGCPLLVRRPDAAFNLANFMRAQLFGTIAVLRLGADRLREEGVALDFITAHGGLFKTPGVAQRMVAGAFRTPVRVMETAGEGGAFGIAVLAAYMLRENPEERLPDYLDGKVFADAKSTTLMADASDAAGFNIFLTRYKKALPMERAAVETM